MRNLLHLQPHTHTGQLLPHHHTSYRGLLLLLLVVGVAMGAIQHTAHADQLSVFAKVSAPTPTVAAVIMHPVAGSTVSTAVITVSGTCQFIAPSSIVALYDNGQLAGSANCSSSGTFSLAINLETGNNSLLAKTANVTGDYGPDSSPITVYYQPIITPPTPGGSTGPVPDETGSNNGGSGMSGSSGTGDSANGDTLPLQIKSTQTYLEFGQSAPAVWQFAVTGGKAPYNITIEWGDGKMSSLVLTDSSVQKLTHRYTHSDPTFATITASDANGIQKVFVIAAVTPFSHSIYPLGPTTTIPFLQSTPGILVLCYGAYVLMLALLAAAWYDARIHRLKLASIYLFPRPPKTSKQARARRKDVR